MDQKPEQEREALPIPPPVIHNVGDAHPGEANPARDLTSPTGEPAVSTAEFLAAREAAEEAISRGERVSLPTRAEGDGGAVPYGDAGIGENVVLTRPDQADQQQIRLGANDANRVLDAPHTDMALGSLGHVYDATSARVDAKNEANARDIQRAGSMSGLDSRSAEYDRMEYGEAQMNEVRDEVVTTGTHSMGIPQPAAPAPNVLAIFPDLAAAQRAIYALQNIGIAARDIQVAGGDWAGTADDLALRDSGTAGDLGSDPVAPGEGADIRSTPPADPHIYSDYSTSDADYRSTAATGAAQTGGAAATASAGGVSGEVQLSVRTDRLTHGPVERVLADNGATEVH